MNYNIHLKMYSTLIEEEGEASDKRTTAYHQCNQARLELLSELIRTNYGQFNIFIKNQICYCFNDKKKLKM